MLIFRLIDFLQENETINYPALGLHEHSRARVILDIPQVLGKRHTKCIHTNRPIWNYLQQIAKIGPPSCSHWNGFVLVTEMIHIGDQTTHNKPSTALMYWRRFCWCKPMHWYLQCAWHINHDYHHYKSTVSRQLFQDFSSSFRLLLVLLTVRDSGTIDVRPQHQYDSTLNWLRSLKSYLNNDWT